MNACCRTCSRSDNFQTISVDAVSANTGEPVYLMLIYCTQLQITNRDNFPQQICYDCMNRLDAAFAFWKQSRQADATLQQQLVLGSNGVDSGAITTTTITTATTNSSYLCEGQTQPLPEDEGSIQVEECKFNPQTQVIAVDEDGEPDSEVETVLEEPPVEEEQVEQVGFEDEALTHQQYIIDSEAESEVEEEQEPETLKVARSMSKPTFKIKINHTKKSQPVTMGRLKCQLCKLTFHTTTHLRRHLKMHASMCQHCGKTFSSSNARNRHQSLNCSVLKNVSYTTYCEHCHRGFSNQKTKKKHQARVCPVLHPAGSIHSRSSTCKYCHKGFSSSQNMLRHQRENCPVLKRPVIQPPSSSAHITKQCAHCRKRFNTSKEIKRHVRQCMRRKPAPPMLADDIDSPNYEVHPSEMLDCVMKQEPDEFLGD